MDKARFRAEIMDIFATLPGNAVAADEAISSEIEGLVMFDAPIVGFASARDTLFEDYERTGIVGPWHMRPKDWLSDAASVASMFFPFTERVRQSNHGAGVSAEWLHATSDGQKFILKFASELCRRLASQGIACCAPSIDARFRVFRRGEGLEGYPEATELTFGSNWSERHAAYACGLGTFGLSRGIITEKGMAGRFTSVIMNATLAPDPRPYKDVYEYCVRCGECIRRCPAHAITFERGKEHIPCSQWLKVSCAKFAPRSGCGQCQTAVPCEDKNPAKTPRSQDGVTHGLAMDKHGKAGL